MVSTDELDDLAHNFTIEKTYEVAQILEKLLGKDECLRIKVASMFAVVMSDRYGMFKTHRRLNNFQDTTEKLREEVMKVYKEDFHAASH